MIVGLQIADVQHFEHLMDTKSYTNHLYVVIKHSQAATSHGNLRNVTATARYRKYFNIPDNATTSPYANSSQHGSMTANATASRASQHNMTVQLPPHLPPLRQICAHTPLKALSVPIFPQVRHFMHKHVFQESGVHKTELQVESDAASFRRARSPPRRHDAQCDMRWLATDNRRPFRKQRRQLRIDGLRRPLSGRVVPCERMRIIRIVSFMDLLISGLQHGTLRLLDPRFAFRHESCDCHL